MRLDKYLSDASAYSRREIEMLVRRRAVTVNGETARKAAQQVREQDVVTVNGGTVSYRRYVYLMLNKPAGYLSATEDKRDPVVVDLLPEEFRHFHPFPVGRLDKDTTGLLLLTNDGAFDHALTSPRKEVKKRYLATLDRPAEAADAELFRQPMDLGDFVTRPAELLISSDPTRVTVIVSEGKFHQVKRMCAKAGKNVLALHREAIGPVVLDPALPPGGMRELTAAEMTALNAEK